MIQERHSPGDPLLSVAEAGEYLGTGERFIRRLITERRSGYVKIGKYVRLGPVAWSLPIVKIPTSYSAHDTPKINSGNHAQIRRAR